MIKELIVQLETVGFTADWVSALAALIGIPAAIVGFVALFRKDKEKQEQIRALTSIANLQEKALTKLHEHVLELSKQTNEFEKQTHVMIETQSIYNELLKISNQDIELKRANATKEEAAEEERKLLNSRPNFIINHVENHGDNNVKFIFKNIGHKAFKCGIYPLIQRLFDLVDMSQDKIIYQDEFFYITFKIKNNQYPDNLYWIDLKYEDEYKRIYKQELSIKEHRIKQPALIYDPEKS